MLQNIKNLLKIILGNLYFPLFANQAKKQITQTSKSLNNIEAIYNWTETFCVGPSIRGLNINFKSSQIKEEITELLLELSKTPPKVILEIGTATGGTLFMFTQVATKDAEIISIDMPFGRYGAGYLKYRIPLMQAFAKGNQNMHLLRLDSHNHDTLNRLKHILNGKTIDFLFIDGDHTYEGVKKDFEMYSPLVTKGGKIAFHDIVKNEKDSSFGTNAFWEEIKKNYDHKEFIRQNPAYVGCGIGLITRSI